MCRTSEDLGVALKVGRQSPKKQNYLFRAVDGGLGDRPLGRRLKNVAPEPASLALSCAGRTFFCKSRSNGYRGSSSIKYPIGYDLPIIGYGFRVIG